MSTTYTIHEKFASIVQRNPESVAIKDSGTNYTYQKVHDLSNAIASAIATKGVQLGDIIGLFMGPSAERVISMFAVLKAGACYVPIDPDMPFQYNKSVIEDCKPKFVLTTREYSVDLSNMITDDKNFSIVIDMEMLEETSDQPFTSISMTGQELAYIIYTSGSTGIPQGVRTCHSGLCSLADESGKIFKLGSNNRMLQYASMSFDASIFEIIIALFSGSTLYIAKREKIMPGEPLVRFIHQSRIDFLCLPPSSLSILDPNDNRLSSLKNVIVAGEKCPKKLAEEWSKDRQLYNAYGPTEATICTTVHKCTPDSINNEQFSDSIPIGFGLSGFLLKVVEENGEEVKDGSPGELHIIGDAVSLGYVSEDTKNKFFVDSKTGLRGFKTGDIVKRLENGEYLFVGRKDNQVKVNGFRLELENIENVLLQNDSVVSCAVVVRKDIVADQNTLVAYIVPRKADSTGNDILSNIKMHARCHLPYNMQPYIYVIIDQMPMMSNGSKIDRTALQQSDFISKTIKTNEDGSEIEKCVALMFKELLSVEPDYNEDFFAMGGSSLLATRLMGAVSSKYGILIPVHLMYRGNSSVKTVAKMIENATTLSDSIEEVDYIEESKIDDCVNVHTEHSEDTLSSFHIDLNTNEPINVFMTGASGFLGGNLLQEIISQAPHIHVHVLVRCNSEEDGRLKIEENLKKLKLWNPDLASRFTPIIGDVSKERLGLSESLYEDLASTCHIVYHAAADISYVKSYEAIRASNVEGTHNMLKFTTFKKVKPFHYVSSVCVFGPARQFLGLDILLEDEDIMPILEYMYVENGYTKSKWVAEKMVRTAVERGVPAKIYRPGFIEASSKTGISNPTDFMCRFIKGCIQIGFYPDLPTKYWTLTNGDFVAAAISHISIHKSHLNKSTVFHTVPNRSTEPSSVQIFEYMISMGYKLNKVPIKIWLEEVQKILANEMTENALYPVAAYILERVYAGRNTILELHHHSPACSDKNSAAALEGTGIGCDTYNKNAFEKYTKFMIGQGWLSSPQEYKL